MKGHMKLPLQKMGEKVPNEAAGIVAPCPADGGGKTLEIPPQAICNN